MDFAKLFSMISSKAIYFTPAFIMRKNEPYEFRVPHSAMPERSSWIDANKSIFNDLKEAEFYFEKYVRFMEEDPLYGCGISCWHINERENNALWRSYVPNGGVAIKSSWERIYDALDVGDRFIFADNVHYIDHAIDSYYKHPSAQGWELIYHKAKFFEFENEFRFSFNFMGESFEKMNLDERDLSLYRTEEERRAAAEEYAQKQKDKLKNLPNVNVDLEKMIDEVVVSPGVGEWYFDLVSGLIANHVSSNIKVRRSSVDIWTPRNK